MGSAASCILVQNIASQIYRICGGSGMGGVWPAIASSTVVVGGVLKALLPMLAVTSAHSWGGANVAWVVDSLKRGQGTVPPYFLAQPSYKHRHGCRPLQRVNVASRVSTVSIAAQW